MGRRPPSYVLMVHYIISYIFFQYFPEIPGLLSTMWQTLGQTSHHTSSHQTVSTIADSGGYAPYTHHHPGSAHSAQDRGFSPPRSLHHQPMSNHSGMDEEDLSGDMSNYGAPVSGSEDEVTGGDLGLGSDLGEEVPLCGLPDMPEMRIACSEAQCVHGDANSHVRASLDCLFVS